MKLQNRYLKCFSKEKFQQLKDVGFLFLYEQNGVYYFENNDKLIKQFSKDNLFENTKSSMTINF